MLVRWNDFTPRKNRVNNQMEELNRLADHFFSFGPFSHNNLWSNWNVPTTHTSRFLVREEEDHYSLTADFPGTSAENIDIQTTAEELTIKVNLERQEREGYKTIISERTTSSVEQSFKLPKHIDPQSVEARLIDGVLTVKVYKTPEVQPRKIEISVA